MNPAQVAAEVVIDELLRGGVTDIVVAPGQRSAPLALAAATAAESGECVLHVRTDERVAGFVALGLARISGRPTAVICTSGSAVANLLPAVTEADMSGAPLVLLTADRPVELRGVGANQTIDQPGIFGQRVRMSIDMEAPVWRRGVAGYWRSTVCQAVNCAADAIAPGPVHLNVAVREPLIRDDSDLAAIEADSDLQGRPDGRPWTLDARMVSVAALSIDSLLEQLGLTVAPTRGLVVVGDLAAGEPYCSEATALAEGLNWPLICEPSGNAFDGGTVIAHGALLSAVPSWRTSMVPDVVVTVGRVGLQRGVNSLIAATPVHIAVDPGPANRPVDPLRSASAVVAAVPAPADSCAATADWVQAWLTADDLAESVITGVLNQSGMCGPLATRIVWDAVPGDGLLSVAASWPVRHLDSYRARRTDPPWVIGNRGTSGIDGLVATSWGAATAFQRPPALWEVTAAEVAGEPLPVVGGPAVSLIGDLAFLYDLSALFVPGAEGGPNLTYVVLDNDGGGIFSMLEGAQAASSGVFERVMGTPLGKDIASLVSAAGYPVTAVATPGELADALSDALGRNGVQVIVCRTGERQREAAIVDSIRGELQQFLEAPRG